MKTDLDDLLCYQLFQVVKLNEQLIDKHMEQFELSRTQWKVIARFNFLPIPCTQQQLLMSMGIDRAHLARTLDRLEARGLIQKERLPNDKRAYHIFLTQTGKHLLHKIEKQLKSGSDILVKGMSTSEQSALTKTLQHIKDNVLVALNRFS